MNVRLLDNNQKSETLAFLETRPIETVFLRSSIHDNGLTNTQNRGSFYGCYDNFDNLTGLALLGHFFLVESYDESATMELARFARTFNTPRLIRGETNTIEKFWNFYSQNEFAPRLCNRELLLVQSSPVNPTEIENKVRPATTADVPLLVEVNAQMACDEGGDNPLEIDPVGFRRRLQERVNRGRVWVCREGDSLLFKSDVLAQTPESVYIEGVYVAPEKRKQGFGKKCLAQLGSVLLNKAESVCLTVNVENEPAINLYKKIGYKHHCDYTTIYLNRLQTAVA